MLKVGENVEFVDFVETLDSLVFGFRADSVALKYSHIQITSYHTRIKVLTCNCDAACSNKRVIDKVAGLYLSLIRH